MPASDSAGSFSLKTHPSRFHSRTLGPPEATRRNSRSEEHTSELQSHSDLVCRLLLEKKKKSRKNSRIGAIFEIEDKTWNTHRTKASHKRATHAPAIAVQRRVNQPSYMSINYPDRPTM